MAAHEPRRPDHPGPRIGRECTRIARPADVDAIAAITAARQGTDLDETRAWVAEEVAGLSQSEDRILFVAAIDGEVVGFGRVRYLVPDPEDVESVAPEGWYLAGIVVTPGARRRGVGAALTAQRLDWIRARADTAWYFVNRVNQASIDLHQAFDFSLVGSVGHKRSQLAPEDGLLFRRDLGDQRGA